MYKQTCNKTVGQVHNTKLLLFVQRHIHGHTDRQMDTQADSCIFKKTCLVGVKSLQIKNDMNDDSKVFFQGIVANMA